MDNRHHGLAVPIDHRQSLARPRRSEHRAVVPHPAPGTGTPEPQSQSRIPQRVAQHPLKLTQRRTPNRAPNQITQHPTGEQLSRNQRKQKAIPDGRPSPGERPIDRAPDGLRYAKGKYRGQPLAYIAATKPDYLEWMLREPLMEDTKKIVREALAQARQAPLPPARPRLSVTSLDGAPPA